MVSGMIAWLMRRSVIGRFLYFFFILLVESSLIVWLVGGFLFFLLFLLLLKESPVYIITVAEVQYENDDCETDEKCPREVHCKDWSHISLMLTFYRARTDGWT